MAQPPIAHPPTQPAWLFPLIREGNMHMPLWPLDPVPVSHLKIHIDLPLQLPTQRCSPQHHHPSANSSGFNYTYQIEEALYRYS